MICALIYCMCYLYLQFIWPCLEIKSEFFTTRKKSQQQTLSSNCSSNTNPFCDLSTQFDLNQWNSGHFGQSKRKFARHFVDLLATKSHFFVSRDKRDLLWKQIATARLFPQTKRFDDFIFQVFNLSLKLYSAWVNFLK